MSSTKFEADVSESAASFSFPMVRLNQLKSNERNSPSKSVTIIGTPTRPPQSRSVSELELGSTGAGVTSVGRIRTSSLALLDLHIDLLFLIASWLDGTDIL
jgi:hypothetical protein